MQIEFISGRNQYWWYRIPSEQNKMENLQERDSTKRGEPAADSSMSKKEISIRCATSRTHAFVTMIIGIPSLICRRSRSRRFGSSWPRHELPHQIPVAHEVQIQRYPDWRMSSTGTDNKTHVWGVLDVDGQVPSSAVLKRRCIVI